MMRRMIALGLLLFIGWARSAVAAELEDLKQSIEWAIKDNNVPAIGIALVNRDGPVWVAGWGKANIASGRAADQDTLFRIGSVSKMFAGLAVLKLVEEGKLSLDDKVRDRVPDVAFENRWEATHPVRIAHLLEHTTGWDDRHPAESVYAGPDTMTTKEALDYHPDSRTSRWPPGSRHAYSALGSVVAAYIVEKVSGQRFEDYIAKEFFTPLGMASTSYFKTKLYDERGATLYLGQVPQEYLQLIYRPPGSINSTARDMAEFLHFLLMRGSTANGQIVSAASMDRMETPSTMPGNAAGVLAGYGLANYTSGYHAMGVAFHGHGGAVLGGLTELAYVRELGEGYVFMINCFDSAAVAQISDLLKGYLLRDVRQPGMTVAALPERYKTIDGYYHRINPRTKDQGLMISLMELAKVTHDERSLHRSPVFASWISYDYYAGAHEVLVDSSSGLPSVAVIEDPLVGPALQVGSDVMMRVAAWKVFARFGTLALLVAMPIVGLIALVVWWMRRRRMQTTDGRLWLRLWPLVASAVLLADLIMSVVAGKFWKLLGAISVLSVGLFVLSLVYPAVVLLGVAYLFKTKAREPMNLPYWFAVLFVVVHLLTAGYLAMYGVIGGRTWA